MENWIRENVNFFDIKCSKAEKVKIITNKTLEEEFFNYANNFKESAYMLTKKRSRVR